MNFKEANERLLGRYDQFALAFAPQLAEALRKPGRKVTCPVYGEKNKFNVHKGFATNGKWYSYIEPEQPHGVFNLLAWVTGATKKEILDFAVHYLDGIAPLSPKEIAQKKAQEKREKEERRKENAARLNKIWREAIKGCTPEIETYLRHWRGINNLIPPQNVLFHPSLFYSNGEEKGESPCLLVRMDTPEGQAATLHRIYLEEGTFKKSSLGKRMLPPSREVMGSAARLYPIRQDGVLGIAEGVETAIAVTSKLKIPTWAALSAPMLGGFIPPKGVKKLIIWADKDRSGTGQHYAELLKERMRTIDIKAEIMLPPKPVPEGKKGIDWLDVLYPADR
ncbi:DUF7146 domain-containing protein [Galenea microaerophila]